MTVQHLVSSSVSFPSVGLGQGTDIGCSHSLFLAVLIPLTEVGIAMKKKEEISRGFGGCPS